MLIKSSIFISVLMVFACGHAAPFIPFSGSYNQSLPNKELVLSATHHIAIEGSSCTGTFINNEGFILTAQHCLNKLFLNRGLTEKTIFTDQIGSSEVHRIKRDNLNSVEVEIDFRNLTRNQNYVIKKYKIFALGAFGWIQDVSKITTTSVKNLVSQRLSGLSNEGDFVILMPSNPSENIVGQWAQSKEVGTININCLKNDNVSGDTGSFMWNVSFPKFQRQSQSSTMDMQISEGYLRDSLEQLVGATHVPFENMARNPKHMMLSDVDFAGGSSGSAMINALGYIAGINVASVLRRTETTEFNPLGSTLGIRIEFMINTLREIYGQAAVSSAFNCPQE